MAKRCSRMRAPSLRCGHVLDAHWPKKSPEAVCHNLVSVLPLLNIFAIFSECGHAVLLQPFSFVLVQGQPCESKCQVLFLPLLLPIPVCLARAVTSRFVPAVTVEPISESPDLPAREMHPSIPEILPLLRRGATNPRCLWRRTRVRRISFRSRYIFLM